MTDEEIRARAIEIARGLSALDEMGDEEEQQQTLNALMKAIDEEPLSALKLRIAGGIDGGRRVDGRLEANEGI